MSDIDTIREALKWIIGKSRSLGEYHSTLDPETAHGLIVEIPHECSEALAALDRLQAQQPNAEPVAYVYSRDYEALHDLLMRGGEALGRQWNHPGTRIVIPTDIRPLHVPQWQHMMMLDKARFAKVCSEMNLEWIAPSTEPRLTVEQAWPYLQHKKGCNMLSFTNSMMSHAPISQRLCDCGLDELRSSLTKAAKP